MIIEDISTVLKQRSFPVGAETQVGQWLTSIPPTGTGWLRRRGGWRGERLRPIGWLLITAVLLSMLKHIGSRWAGSPWLREALGGCYGLESNGGDRATGTPILPVMLSAATLRPSCIHIWENTSENVRVFQWKWQKMTQKCSIMLVWVALIRETLEKMLILAWTWRAWVHKLTS